METTDIFDIEQNDLYDIMPTFAELGMKEYDEADDMIRQHVQELRQEECRKMSYNSLDSWIKGQLAAFAFSEFPKNKKTSQESRSRITYQYRYDAQHTVCMSTYAALTGISLARLHRIKSSIKNEGIVENIHGNIGRTFIRSDRAIVDEEIKQEINNFIHNYANIHGFPSPGRHMRQNAIPIISLPVGTRYTDVYEEYIKFIELTKSENYKIIAYITFFKIWKEVVYDVRLMTKASDLCDKCEQLRAEIRVTNDLESKQKLQNEYNLHRTNATIERQHYNNNISMSKQLEFNIVHICYDWAQNVQIPYLPQQPGGLFFKSPFNVHIFGIANTGLETQRNYLIGEHQFPKKTPKGANTTLNFIMDHIETIINQSKKNRSNIAVRYDSKNQLGWNYYDFENFLEPYFVKIDGIRAYRHFYFYHDQPGKIFMTLESNGIKKEAIIRNNVQFDPYKPLTVIPLKPLTLKRQTQLFKDIRPYIHNPHKDELCFAPREQDYIDIE
ncbi:10147_t:CDS:2 [Cetraspora pellucida]|uniref:10147_t:CDS:1 n=1 Tax=Cetraspora pellucida TaxID=1433469 RepID=A0ACA9L9F7_9GLOM|nr:10147_t:CDS:2 [Cetraspora pellucida]